MQRGVRDRRRGLEYDDKEACNEFVQGSPAYDETGVLHATWAFDIVHARLAPPLPVAPGAGAEGQLQEGQRGKAVAEAHTHDTRVAPERQAAHCKPVGTDAGAASATALRFWSESVAMAPVHRFRLSSPSVR